jgi:hypothetical protein
VRAKNYILTKYVLTIQLMNLHCIDFKNINGKNEALTEGVRLSEKLCEFAEPLEHPSGPREVHRPNVGNQCCILDE